jgi:hypothetical protein
MAHLGLGEPKARQAPPGPVGPDAETAISSLQADLESVQADLQTLSEHSGTSQLESDLEQVQSDLDDLGSHVGGTQLESDLDDVTAKVDEICNQFSFYDGALAEVASSAC